MADRRCSVGIREKSRRRPRTCFPSGTLTLLLGLGLCWRTSAFVTAPAREVAVTLTGQRLRSTTRLRTVPLPLPASVLHRNGGSRATHHGALRLKHGARCRNFQGPAMMADHTSVMLASASNLMLAPEILGEVSWTQQSMHFCVAGDILI